MGELGAFAPPGVWAPERGMPPGMEPLGLIPGLGFIPGMEFPPVVEPRPVSGRDWPPEGPDEPCMPLEPG